MDKKLTAMMNDQRLMEAAKYKRTNGMMKDCSQDVLLEEFTYMKKKVLAGKTTISKLEENVFNKYGVQEKVKMQLPGQGGMGFGPSSMQGPEGSDDTEVTGFGTAQ